MTDNVPHLVDRIADQHVIAVLALLLEQQHPLPDPAQAGETQARLASAATAADPVEVLDDPSDRPPIHPAPGTITPAALARAALTHLLSTQPQLTDTALPRAERLAANPPQDQRLDPATLAVAGLVLVVLQTEVDWTRTDTGRWKLRVQKRAMADSTLTTLIRGLFNLPQTPDATGPREPTKS